MKDKILETWHLVTQWFAEVAGFILLPLFVYVIVLAALGVGMSKLIELPEWMFVSVILFGHTTRKSIAYYKDCIPSHLEANKETSVFKLKMDREVSKGIFGIVISAVFLILTMVAENKNEALKLATPFYWAQIGWFGIAVCNSLYNRIFIGWKTGEGKRLRFIDIPKD